GPDLRATGGALGGHDEGTLGAVAQGLDRAEDLGGHVPGLAQHDRVADQHALALDVQLVCRGRLLRRRARHPPPLPEPYWSDAPGLRFSGFTSPALRSTFGSPISTALRSTSNWLCSVAFSTVEPATSTGSMIPKGVTRPVRPTCTWMSRSLVVTSSGGNFTAV